MYFILALIFLSTSFFKTFLFLPFNFCPLSFNSENVLEDLTIVRLVKKFTVFYETWEITATLSQDPNTGAYPKSQTNEVHSTLPRFIYLLYIIILSPNKLRPYKWPLAFKLIHISRLFHAGYTLIHWFAYSSHILWSTNFNIPYYNFSPLCLIYFILN